MGRIGRTLTILTLLPLAGACGLRANPAPPGPPPSAGPPSRVRTEFLQGRLVEVQIESPLAPGPKPAVLSFVADARVPLLEAGAVVVTVKMHWELLRGLPRPAPPVDETPAPPPETAPGKPVGSWLLAAPTPKTVGKGYFAIIGGTVRTAVPAALDLLATDPDVDPARIGILGHSTNGFLALEAVATQPRIRVAAVVAGCGDYHDFLHHSSLAMKGAPLDLDPAYERTLREREVVRHPARVVHAALIMVNGRDDAAVPASCALATARVLRRAYRAAGAPERFRFVLAPGGHTLGEEARREVLAWFQRWLFATPS